MTFPYFKSSFFLGSLELKSNIFCAPLASCSDYPFRKMLMEHRPGLFFCEMVKMEALLRAEPSTLSLLDYDTGMHPIGAQIVGSKPRLAAKAARIVESLGFDVLDLNCGCPVDKVTKDGSGSKMLRDPQRIGDVLSEMVAQVKIPVTVKIRTGWDEESINAVEVTKIAEQAGASAVTIHGRTRTQAYKGQANWDIISQCKKAAKKIKVIGNGDIFSPDAAASIFNQTDCDAILLARGTLGQPWLVQDIERVFQGKEPVLRSDLDILEYLKRHFEHSLKYYSEKKAVIDMRKLACWYFKKGKKHLSFRKAIVRVESKMEAYRLLQDLEVSLGKGS